MKQDPDGATKDLVRESTYHSLLFGALLAAAPHGVDVFVEVSVNVGCHLLLAAAGGAFSTRAASLADLLLLPLAPFPALFVTAALLAFLLDIPCRWLVDRGLPRPLALAMVLGVFGFLTWKLWPHLSTMLGR
jgi:hypothetical protein